MIIPTNGRIVWYTPIDIDGELGSYKHSHGQPLAAMITHVWHDRCVNLVVFPPDRLPALRTSVQLVQSDDDLRPTAGGYAEWMPYQKGQAAMLDAVKAEHDLLQKNMVKYPADEDPNAGLAGSSEPGVRLLPRAAPTL